MLTELRLQDLADNIRKDLNLLKAYEDELRYETDPRRLAMYRREIERQRESLTRSQQEYDELQKQVTGVPSAYMVDTADLLQQMDAKLDDVQELQPPIWNVPHHRNPNFTGRKGILKELRLALTSGEPAAWKQAITGMGGVGKTQLAVEYIYRHKAEYRVIWWVRSEEPATMAADYASLAVDLNLQEKDSEDQNEMVETVKRWLEHNPGWLLIFDNAQDTGEIRNYLPQAGAGHVIITSRNPLCGSVAKLLSARVFDRAESIEFLCKRTGQEDKKTADALADELGDLPLALEQAGAYIGTTGIALTEYQELFQSRRKELWEDESPPQDYPSSVAATWSSAMEQVSQETQGAVDLLNLCAFLAPDDISMKIFSGGAEHIPEPLATTAADKLAMNRAIKALRQYSLIATSGEFLSVHRLVQAVVRDRLGEEGKKRWSEAAIRLLSAAFPSDSYDVRTWHQCSHLLPHALTAAAHAARLGVAPEVMQYILNQTSKYMQLRSEFAEPLAHLEVGLEQEAFILEHQEYGVQHKQVTGDLPAWMQDTSDQVRQIDAKLDDVLSGQKVMQDDLKDLRKTLLARFDASEQAIISTIVQRLDQNQLATVQSIVDEIETHSVPENELQETLSALQQALLEIRQTGLNDSQLMTEATDLSEMVDDPKLDVNHKLKVSIPIIPLILSYETEVELKSGLNLKTAWQRLKAGVRGER
jgi:hypothetical protein